MTSLPPENARSSSPISGIDRRFPFGILRPIHKADQIAVIEVAKSVYLIHGFHSLADPCHDFGRQFETHRSIPEDRS
jgi:hypothetical protein